MTSKPHSEFVPDGRPVHRHLAMLRAILTDYQDVISGPDVQRGIDAVDSLEEQLEAIRRAVDQNEQGPEYGWTHPDEEAHDLRRKLRLILGDLFPASGHGGPLVETPSNSPPTDARGSNPASGERVATGDPSRTSSQGANQSPEESSPATSSEREVTASGDAVVASSAFRSEDSFPASKSEPGVHEEVGGRDSGSGRSADGRAPGSEVSSPASEPKEGA